MPTQSRPRRRPRAPRTALGLFGVYKPKDMRRYRARVTSGGLHFHLGYFDTPEQAAHVRGIAAAALDGGASGLRDFLRGAAN